MQRFASVVLVDRRGWLLLQERDEHAPIDPECWGFVGGHLERGEDYEAGAHRELEEETGLRLDGGLRPFGTFTVHHAHTGTDDEFGLFTAEVDLTDDDVECHEGRRIVFVDPSLVTSLPLTVAARQTLPVLLASDWYAGRRSA